MICQVRSGQVIRKLQDIPNIGRATLKKLLLLGIREVAGKIVRKNEDG